MGHRGDAEQLGQRLRQIGEGGAIAEIGAGTGSRAAHEQRHVLARVIRARRRRIVAVVGGDDEQVVGTQLRQELAQPRVEALEVPRVALDVVAMPVDRVEVDEVGEDQSPLDARDRLLHRVHPLIVTRRVHRRPNAAAGEEILNLAHRVHRRARGRQPIEQRLAAGRTGEIVTIRGALELSRRADERARDHPPDAHALDDELVGDAADAVLLLDRNHILVREDLEHAVGRGVDDRRAGAHVLGAEAVHDLRARPDQIANRATTDAPLELGDHLGGEPAGKRGKRALEHDPHHFPVAGHRILPR